jgi:CheY-like chemotaxis protein
MMLEYRSMSGRNSSRIRAVPMVLVVDDHRAMADAACRLLAGVGYATHLVGTLAEAREFLGVIQPDCVVLDVRLPDGDVQSLLVDLARSRAAPPTVVVSSGSNARGIAMNFGVPLVSKPIDPEHFLAAVQVAMDTCIKPVEPRNS